MAIISATMISKQTTEYLMISLVLLKLRVLCLSKTYFMAGLSDREKAEHWFYKKH